MRPTVASLARHEDQAFRCVTTHELKECEYVAMVRFDGPLFFANASYLEDKIMEIMLTKENLKHIIIVSNGINDIDASGEAAALVKENLAKEAVRPTNRSKKAVEDFILSSSVELALLQEGHNVSVSAEDGKVTLIINKHVLLLGRLEEELESVADKVPGVRSVETNVGPGFHQADIYRKYDFEMPSKILLVDDEREFVQTLSERLEMRDIGSAVTYDGASALDLVKEDEPDVMILDLKMPGIDGIEVLRRVKETQPEIEVIILTGHGSEADRETCMKLGAFAYLQKPVDIKILSDTIEKANEKIREKKANKD